MSTIADARQVLEDRAGLELPWQAVRLKLLAFEPSEQDGEEHL
jgi:hypothetical protein